MDNNKRFVDLLCLVSLVCVVILVIIGSILYYQNVKIKSHSAWLEKNIISLDENLRHYQQTSKAQDKTQKEALDYLRWRFVLKEQVEQASRRFFEKSAGARKDKELANLIYYNLGLAHTLSSNFDSAINDFQEALKYDPKDAYSYYNLALLYSTYKQAPQAALSYYKEYQELSPKGLYSEEVADRIKQLQESIAGKSQK